MDHHFQSACPSFELDALCAPSRVTGVGFLRPLLVGEGHGKITLPPTTVSPYRVSLPPAPSSTSRRQRPRWSSWISSLPKGNDFLLLDTERAIVTRLCWTPTVLFVYFMANKPKNVYVANRSLWTRFFLENYNSLTVR